MNLREERGEEKRKGEEAEGEPNANNINEANTCK